MPNKTGKGVKIETTLNLNIIRVHTRLLYLFKHKFSAHHILIEILQQQHHSQQYYKISCSYFAIYETQFSLFSRL